MSKTTRLILIGAAAVAVGVMAWLVVDGQRQRVLYHEAKGALDVYEKDLADYKAQAKARDDAYAADIKKRDDRIYDLTFSVRMYENAQVQLQVELAKEKAKTAALPDDALSAAINARIGAGASWPTGGAMFAFTRAGAEATLNRFLDGEGWAKRYENEHVIAEKLNATVAEKNGVIADWSWRFDLKVGELAREAAAHAGTKDALKHLERSRAGATVKSFLIGALAGFAARQGLLWMGWLK